MSIIKIFLAVIKGQQIPSYIPGDHQFESIFATLLLFVKSGNRLESDLYYKE